MLSFLNTSGNRTIGTECFINDSAGVKVARSMVYSIIILVSVFGNTGIIRIIWKERRMRHSINYFIGNMSASDLLMTVGYMPRMVAITNMGYEWHLDGNLGLIFCKTVSFLYDTCVCVSIFTAIAISLDRFLAVAFPLRIFITNRRSKIMIAVIWLTATLIQFPNLYASQLVQFRGKTRCHSALDQIFMVGFSKLYYITVSSIYVSSLCTTVILYVLIMIYLKLKRDRLLGSQKSFPSGRNSREKSCRNVVHMVLAVIGFFVFSWTLFVLQLVLYSHNMILSKSCNVNFIVGLLAHSNCAITPFLYAKLSENYRKGFKQMCYCSWRDEVELSSVTLRLRNAHSVQRGAGNTAHKRTVSFNTCLVRINKGPGSEPSGQPVSPPPTPTGSFPLPWRRVNTETFL